MSWRTGKLAQALERHWTAAAAGDQDVEHEIYRDDAIVEYPQSGERIRGRQNVQALRSHHPAGRRVSSSGECSGKGTSGSRST